MLLLAAIPKVLGLFNRRSASPEMAEQEAKMSAMALGMPPGMMGGGELVVACKIYNVD